MNGVLQTGILINALQETIPDEKSHPTHVKSRLNSAHDSSDLFLPSDLPTLYVEHTTFQ